MASEVARSEGTGISATSYMEVEVVYAEPMRQDITALKLPVGTTAREAVEIAGVIQRHSTLDLSVCRLAVYGRLIDSDYRLRDGDRVELLRPLVVDPKEARLRRAQHRRRARG